MKKKKAKNEHRLICDQCGKEINKNLLDDSKDSPYTCSCGGEFIPAYILEIKKERGNE